MIEHKIKHPVLTASLFLLPALFLYTLFMIYPIIDAVVLSFHDWNGIPGSPIKAVGMKNYRYLFSSPRFYRALKNVGVFILQGLFFQGPIAFILALIVSGKLRARRFYKVAFFLPVILPMTSVGLMWQYILRAKTGLVNTLLRGIGLDAIAMNWLGDPSVAIFSVAFVSAWIFAGMNMIIFSAGLVAIPDTLYEAARIEGAGAWRRLISITLPLMTDAFKVYMILMITGSLKVFDIIFVMTGGGPNGASDVPATLLYYEAFKYNHFGLGNAVGTFILLASLLLTVVLNRLFKSKEEIYG